MTFTDTLDVIVRQRQEKCDHNYQDRVVTTNKVFCGKCGNEEE